VTVNEAAPIRDLLKSAVLRAMKNRDREALAVYRTTLAAIDNAEAVPVGPSDQAGAIELSAVGPGRTDAQRRLLSEQNMIDIVLGEADERRVAAESLAGVKPGAAQRLHHEADLLQALAEHAVLTPPGKDASLAETPSPS
jgi:hypothetical protein